MALAASDIDILVQQGEGTTLEFKESLSASFAWELVALANTTGGRILLGVTDDGVVKGVKDTNALRARHGDVPAQPGSAASRRGRTASGPASYRGSHRGSASPTACS